MGKRGIKEELIKDGIHQIELTNWKYFPDLINNKFLEYSGYIYRGQREQSWSLEPTLDRLVRELDKTKEKDIQDRLLYEFRLATRGRLNQDRNKIESSDEWWAIGQHYGLATPLLDWTWSPYVAAFFAFHEDGGNDEHVAVWALHEHSIKEKWGKSCDMENKDKNESLYVFNPEMDENIRLINQAGLFTRAPLLTPVEKWIKQHFKGSNKSILTKIIIPKKDREKALIALNRMRINYLTLFPDLGGSSKHCRLRLSIDAYGP